MGALFCCDSFFEKKNRAGLIFCLSMIMLTSYYFSIGSYLAVFVYITSIYLNKKPVFKIKEYIKAVFNMGICMLVSVMISAVLWLPTLNAIIQGRANTNVKVSLKDILLPTIDYKAVLYNPYSLGLTAISLFAIIFALLRKNKGHRFIGIVLSVFMVFKILSFIMNGFMYGEEKAIIPLIPIALLLTAELIRNVFERNISMRSWVLINIIVIICGAAFLLIFKEYAYCFAFIDIVFINTAYIIYNKKSNTTAFISLVSVIALTTCIFTNLSDVFCLKDDVKRVDKDYLNDIEAVDFSDDGNLYRVSQYADEGETINKVYGECYYTTTVYSSLQNQFYNHFYYDEFQNEMPHRNSAMVVETLNPFFYSYMGKKYLFVENETLEGKNITVPYGYSEVKEEINLLFSKMTM